jgi:hypothetical protein
MLARQYWPMKLLLPWAVTAMHSSKWPKLLMLPLRMPAGILADASITETQSKNNYLYEKKGALKNISTIHKYRNW